MKKKKLLREFNKIKEEHTRKLRSHPHIQGFHLLQFPVKNHLYLMFLIEDLIKVSVLALEGMDCSNNRQIKDPGRSISKVLRHVLDLIPIEEQEFIDKSTALLNNLQWKDYS